MVMGEGKSPSKEDLLKLATVSGSGIKKGKAEEIIDQVISAVTRWSDFAQEAGVSLRQTQRIGSVIKENVKKHFR